MEKNEKRKLLWENRKKEGLCVYCGEEPSIDGSVGCKPCLNNKVNQQIDYSKKHKERTALYRKKIKKQAIDKYGGECACCKEKELMFLTIDHINNDGGEERKNMSNGVNTISSTQMYMKLIKTEKRNDLQVLCFNCNLGRNMNGGICPHHKPSPENYEYDVDLRTKKELNIGCKIEWPSNETLIDLVNNSNYSAVGRELNVHATAIKYRLKRRDLLHLIKKK